MNIVSLAWVNVSYFSPALSQGAWYRPDETGTDLGGSINVLTSLHPTPYAKGNPQHTNLVEVEGL